MLGPGRFTRQAASVDSGRMDRWPGQPVVRVRSATRPLTLVVAMTVAFAVLAPTALGDRYGGQTSQGQPITLDTLPRSFVGGPGRG